MSNGKVILLSEFSNNCREYQQFLEENQARIDAHATESRIQHEKDKAEATEYEVILFYPHDLDGKGLTLDATAFSVMESWPALPDPLKEAVLSIVTKGV